MEEFEYKVKGLMFGAALGDAVGLLTELKSKDELKHEYPKKTKFIFPPKDAVRGYALGDWTDETDQLIVVMDTLKDCLANNKLDGFDTIQFRDIPVTALRLKTDQSNRVHVPLNKMRPDILFAYKLKYWVNEGFAAVGDTVGKGCESFVSQAVTRAGYVKNPVGIARNIWSRRNCPATNSCVARTAIIGTLDEFKHVFRVTERFCLVTHPDPRCVAACIVASYLTYTFIHHDIPLEKIEDVIMIAIKNGKHVLTSRKYQEQLDRYCYSSLKNLSLDKEGVQDFALRALGAGIWALRYLARAKNRKNIFKRIIINIILEGGDADCNACVAGAFLGSYLGYKRLPKKWINALPNRDWLEQLIEKYAQAKFHVKSDDSSEDLSYSLEYSDSDDDVSYSENDVSYSSESE